MHDNHGNSALPPGGTEQSLSESNRAESVNTQASDGTSTQTLTIPSNGSSQRKIEANRRNAKQSTGPKTPVGKAVSSWNSARHGLLSKRLPPIYGQHKKQFDRLLSSLRNDLEPVGTLEEVLVEKIAQEYWRLGTAAWHESEELSKSNPFGKTTIDRILRYETNINRQLFQAMHQLERLQRLRKGDKVVAPLSLELLHDASVLLNDENSDQ